MADYISREATVELLRGLGSRDYRREKGTIQDAIKMVSYQTYTPTADVVEVVRCKDCVHWDDDPDTYVANCGPKGKCMKSFETMFADDFCSYGERKE